MENIINLFETETLSQSNLKRMTVKKIIQLIGDPNLFIYYDLILLELANVKDSEKKLTEKFNDYFQTQQNKLEKTKQIKKNNELSLEKEPTPENLIVKKENSSQMENNQEEKEIYPEENNFQEQNKEYENYENKMISSELQKVDSLENFNKQLNEKKSDIHDDNYFSENNKFSEKNSIFFFLSEY